MAASKIKYFSPEELEAIASRFIEVYNKPPDLIPIEIDLLIERDLEIHVLPFIGLQENHGLEAYLALGCKTIYVDNYYMDLDKMERRYRFTLAEEAGHLILHSDLFRGVKTVDEYMAVSDDIGLGETRKMQSDARRLAGAILMPAEIFRRKAIEQAMGSKETGVYLKNFVIIPFLANLFNVSEASASVRFIQLGLQHQIK